MSFPFNFFLWESCVQIIFFWLNYLYRRYLLQTIKLACIEAFKNVCFHSNSYTTSKVAICTSSYWKGCVSLKKTLRLINFCISELHGLPCCNFGIDTSKLKKKILLKYCFLKEEMKINITGLVMISITGLIIRSLDSKSNLLSTCERMDFSSIWANFWPIQFLGPAENGM